MDQALRKGIATALVLAGGWLALFAADGVPAASALPADRAYEMVSPPEKGEADVNAGPHSLSSPGGSTIVYTSSGAFAGSPSRLDITHYLASRMPPSWLTMGISPPMAPSRLVNISTVEAISEDFSRALVRSNAPLAPGAWEGDPLYLRALSSGSYTLVTPPRLDGDSYLPHFVGRDADLSHVLVEADAALTPDAVGVPGVKVYRWANGHLTLESYLPDPDGPGPADASPAAGSAAHGVTGGISTGGIDLLKNPLSRDGSVMFFTSPPSPSSPDRRLYRRESGVTVHVAAEENSGQAVPDAPADFQGATPDGSKVYFTSTERLVDGDTNTATDLYMYTHSSDPQNDANLRLLPLPSVGEPEALGVLGFSDDGSRVYFAGGDLASGENSIFLWEDDGTPAGSVRFVASMGFFGSEAWLPRSSALPFRYVSPTGEALLLVTAAQLTAYDNNSPACEGPCDEVYLYNAGDDEVVCISCNPSGAPPVGPASSLRGGNQRHLSDDGRRAFFDTPEALVPEDTNGRDDVYMWENGQPHLISTGQSSSPSRFAEASSTGDDVFFTTREQLVGWDQDNALDLYDARVGGGLPEPPEQPPACSGDECQGPQSGRPLLVDLGSPLLRGLGDLVPSPRPSFSLRRLSKAQRAMLARGRSVMLAVRVNRAGRVAATARARIAARRRIVARGSKRTGKAGVVRVPLRLSKAARGELAREGDLRIVVSVRFDGAREAERLVLNLKRTVGARGTTS